MIEINNTTESKIDLELVEEVTQEFLKYNEKNDWDVSIAFVDDATIQNLNKQYREKDKVTDILSFESEDENDLGEIVISFDQIKRQASEYSESVLEELIFILVHGLLHLLGHEDHSEDGREEMDKLGKEFIAKNNFLKK